MKRLIHGVFMGVLVVCFYGGLFAGGCMSVKWADRALGVGLWPKDPQLDSVDPWERAEAARQAAQKFGGLK